MSHEQGSVLRRVNIRHLDQRVRELEERVRELEQACAGLVLSQSLLLILANVDMGAEPPDPAEVKAAYDAADVALRGILDANLGARVLVIQSEEGFKLDFAPREPVQKAAQEPPQE